MMNSFFKSSYYLALFVLLTCSCYESDLSSGASDVGTGGSLNRFTIIDSFLYVIDLDKIETYALDNGSLTLKGFSVIDSEIETLYPFDSFILVGGQRGMYICERTSDGLLNKISSYEHIQSCDPVAAKDSLAYVTLSGGCRNNLNQLDILSIKDPFNPVVMQVYPMHRPKGLGLDKNLLFICDTEDGLKIYDPVDPLNLKLLYHFDYIHAVDVIPYKGLLFVLTDTGIVQFDYSDPGNIFELSGITYR